MDFTIEAIKTKRNGKNGYLVTKIDGLTKEELPYDYTKHIDACYISALRYRNKKAIRYYNGGFFVRLYNYIQEGEFYTPYQYKRAIKLIIKSVKKLKRINEELLNDSILEKTMKQVIDVNTFPVI